MTGTGEWVWDRGDYELIGSRIANLAVALVDSAEERLGGIAGRRLADLACGTGSVALEAARRGADVTGVDRGVGLVEQAEAKARAEGLSIRWRVADAVDTGLEDGAFDAVLSSVGVIFVPDKSAQLEEIARLLRQGGVVGWTAWREYTDNPFGSPIDGFLPPPEPDDVSVHDWADEDMMRGYLEHSFEDVRVSEHEHAWQVPNVETAIELVYASPMHLAALAEIPADQHPAVREAFAAAFRRYQLETGVVEFTHSYVVMTAVKR